MIIPSTEKLIHNSFIL